MLWLVSKLFRNYCDWVAFAKAKANVAIVSEVIRKPMWLDCFRWGENQCYGVSEICSKTKCVLVAFANVTANVVLLPSYLGTMVNWVVFDTSKVNDKSLQNVW